MHRVGVCACDLSSECINGDAFRCIGANAVDTHTPPYTHKTYALTYLARLGNIFGSQRPCLPLRRRRLLDALVPPDAPHLCTCIRVCINICMSICVYVAVLPPDQFSPHTQPIHPPPTPPAQSAYSRPKGGHTQPPNQPHPYTHTHIHDDDNHHPPPTPPAQNAYSPPGGHTQMSHPPPPPHTPRATRVRRGESPRRCSRPRPSHGAAKSP